MPGPAGPRGYCDAKRYRLAPEHPSPAAIDDVQAVWRWLRTSQRIGAQSLALAGGSAGGELAVALLVALLVALRERVR